MRKGAFWIVMAIVASVVAFGSVGCSDKKATPIDSTATTTDSGVVVADTMEAIISETPMPKTADELFDDFFFNFAANRKLQFQRIKFPLPVESYGKMSVVSKSQWRMSLLKRYSCQEIVSSSISSIVKVANGCSRL